MSGLSNLQTRIISAVILGAIVLALTYLGGIAFRALAVVMGAAVCVEWRNITGQQSTNLINRATELLLVLSFALLIAGMTPLLVFSTIALAALVGVAATIAGSASRWLPLGIIYAGVPAASLAFLRGDTSVGLLNVLILFGLVWSTDIFAYFVGRAIGGPKLAPSISPNKTWSGAIGGAGAAVAVGIMIAFHNGHAVNPLLPVIILMISIISQGGDLFESWVKRKFGVKDSGTMIPGHGGMMDRVDGLAVAATALYVAISLLDFI
jgi:phosphatidate cytidylyltransferase